MKINILSIDMVGKNGIEAVYEDLDAEFPIALKKKLKDGRQKFAPIKVKAGTDKILPIHAGCVPGATGRCSWSYVLRKNLPASPDDRPAVF